MRHFIYSIIFPLLLTISLLDSCKNSYKVIETNSRNNTVNNDLLTTDSLYSLIAPYKDKLAESMSEVLNISLVDMEVGVPEGVLNDFVADLVLEKSNEVSSEKVDFCLMNNGGLRTPILKGEVTRGMLFELMPFENALVVAELSGPAMEELLNYIVSRSLLGNARTGVSIGGLRLVIRSGELEDAAVGGVPFDTSKIYRVVTSDYLLGGGDEMTFFSAASKVEDLNLKLRDVIIDYVMEEKEKGNNINPQLDGRIQIAE